MRRTDKEPAGGAGALPAVFPMRSRFFVAALCVALGLVLAGGAWAHAVLVESTPADGARLNAPPPEIVLRLNEPVSLVSAQVLDSEGHAVVPAGSASASGATVRIPLPPLPPGSYLVSYRVTSADGHPVAGSLVFAIGTELASLRPAEAPDRGLLAAAAAANRAIHYATLLAAAGAVLFLLFVLRRPHPLEDRLRNGLCALLALAAVSAFLSVGLAGAQVAGLAAGRLASIEPWEAGLATSLGGSIAAALAGLFAIGLGLAMRQGLVSDAVSLAGSIAALSSLTLAGHAATAPPRWLGVSAVLLHAVAAAYWVGSLWPLLVVLKRLPLAEAHAVIRRFSRIAVGAVAALLAAGSTLSVLQLGSVAAIAETGYGWTWLAKLALAVVLLALAAANRLVLTPRLAASASRPTAALRRSIAVELTLVAAIVAATALLGQTPPPRALAAAQRAGSDHDHGHLHGEPQPFHATLTEGGYTAAIEIVPAAPGSNRVAVTIADATAVPIAALEASIELSRPEAGIAPLERPLSTAGVGAFAGEIDAPLPGRWDLRLDVLISDYEKVIFRTAIDIAAP